MNVKRIALFFLFSVFLSGTMHAQDDAASDNEVNIEITPGIYIGFAAGFTSNNIYTSAAGRSNTEYQDGEGFEAAIPLRYVIYPWLALQMELQYIQKNYTWRRTGVYNKVYANVNNSFIDIPLMVNLSFGIQNIRIFANAGGYGGYWITSKVQGAAMEITENPFNNDKYYMNFNEDIEFNEKRDVLFEAGLLAGLGIQVPTDKFTIFVEGRYYYGLTDMRNKDDYGLIIPRINSTLDIRIGLLMTMDSVMELIRGGK